MEAASSFVERLASGQDDGNKCIGIVYDMAISHVVGIGVTCPTEYGGVAGRVGGEIVWSGIRVGRSEEGGG